KEAVKFEQEVKNQENIYSIKQENILSKDFQPFMIAENSSVKVIKPEMGWVGSIFVTGLGQMIMGDVMRGLKFWLFGILGAFLFNIIIKNSGASASLSWGLVHIWSIIDAYQMAEERAVSKAQLFSNRTKIEEFAKTLDKISVLDDKVQFKVIDF
ncbi:MAG: hypothetical protein AABZ74_00535, partial [Cyanobacteriota bacterium]